MQRKLKIATPKDGYCNAPDNDINMQKSYARWIADKLCMNEVVIFDWAVKHRVNLRRVMVEKGRTLAMSADPDIFTLVLNDLPCPEFTF